MFFPNAVSSETYCESSISAHLARTCAAAHDGGNVADGWPEAPVGGRW